MIWFIVVPSLAFALLSVAIAVRIVIIESIDYLRERRRTNAVKREQENNKNNEI